MSHTLRRLETYEDYKACERLQQHAWGFSDALDVIPLTNLVTAQKWGGLVLGAFDEQGRMDGFCYGFLGRGPDNKLVHCSHMLAVHERARNTGLGARIKWAQREHVLEQGLDTIVWTFDPLESVNARLNFGKLGGLSSRYFVNLYGETTSRLHAGMPTDRLTIEWRLDSPRVLRRAEGRASKVAETLVAGEIEVPWALESDGTGPTEPDLTLDEPRVLCEIPVSIQQVKNEDRDAALAWREATRAVFTNYFGRGYFARECVHVPADRDPSDKDHAHFDAGAGRPRTFYLFERGQVETDGITE